MQVHITSTDPLLLVVSEDYDGVNPPAAVTFQVSNHSAGELDIDVFGGDPLNEDEDTDKPTIVSCVYSGDKRTVV